MGSKVVILVKFGDTCLRFEYLGLKFIRSVITNFKLSSLKQR